MNITCSICSEIAKTEDDLVITGCGHCFHRSCIDKWFLNSRTCPTCRRSSSALSLIKVFFEIDDTKMHLNIDEILKTNDKIKNEFEELKKEQSEQQYVLNEMKSELNAAKNNTKLLERQKQIDDMNLTLTKALKNDAQKEIVNLNRQLKVLKLDMLAEKQLRRSYQERMHELEPENENYDISKITADDIKLAQIDEHETEGNSALEKHPNDSLTTPFWKTTVKFKPPEFPYRIPNKIQRALKPNEMQLQVQRNALRWRSRPNLNKPIGFKFPPPVNISTSVSGTKTPISFNVVSFDEPSSSSQNDSDSSQAQGSSSALSTSLNVTRPIFGERPKFEPRPSAVQSRSSVYVESLNRFLDERCNFSNPSPETSTTEATVTPISSFSNGAFTFNASASSYRNPTTSPDAPMPFSKPPTEPNVSER